MATYEHIITNGPGKFDLMLALFDDEDCQRLPVFKAKSDHDDDPYEMQILVMSVKVDGADEKWEINGVDIENNRDVILRYSTKTRKGKCEIGGYHFVSGAEEDEDFVNLLRI